MALVPAATSSPDLADVLAAGADPDGNTIAGAASGGSTGASVLLGAGEAAAAGSTEIRGGDGAVGAAGGTVGLYAGAGHDGAGAPAEIVINGGDSVGAAGGIQVRAYASNGASGQALGSDGGGNVKWITLGSIKLDTIAAPADGALAANELRLWFDATNGAAKLMVKAKQANGTVVTGSVNLA